MARLQKGIYYHREIFHTNPEILSKSSRSRNDSFGILFLIAAEGSTADQVGESVSKLWKMYKSLEKGKVRDLPNCPVPSGELSVLIGYGPSTFNLPGAKKKIPNDLKGSQFLAPNNNGGAILYDSGINYASGDSRNLGLNEHIVIQFISNTQLATNRAIIETWKHLRDNKSQKEEPLCITKFYTGFQRDDGRSWLGFHDEVSNMRPGKEREEAITINKQNNNLSHKDRWTTGGTYMAFLRIEIDVDIWDKIKQKQQECIVGRGKLTGRPLIGIDKKGNPIMSKQCPTASQIKDYNKRFHDHADFFKETNISRKNNSIMDIRASSTILNQSHIGRTRHLDGIPSGDPTSRLIYRQGFDFLEVLENHVKPFRVGLNFVSFQNDPGRLFFILTDPSWMGITKFGSNSDLPGMDRLLSVHGAGVFFVPPDAKPFPGVSIFV
jgi:deferrochelatase/peroxidase EfeB